jgi:hypothetical protein
VANDSRTGATGTNQLKSNDLDRLQKRLELIDERMDNMDSVLTAVAERIMKQPVSITLNCPHCGKYIEIAMVGQQKPT